MVYGGTIKGGHWKGRFRDATLPVLNELYDSVASGQEAARTIQRGSTPNYR